MIALAILAAFVAGYVLAFWHHHDERKWLRAELRVAQAQIAHAVVKDGAQIPMRTEPVPPPDPLDSRLQAIVNDWEDPASRSVEEAKIRGWLGEGHGVPAILRQYGVQL